MAKLVTVLKELLTEDTALTTYMTRKQFGSLREVIK